MVKRNSSYIEPIASKPALYSAVEKLSVASIQPIWLALRSCCTNKWEGKRHKVHVGGCLVM